MPRKRKRLVVFLGAGASASVGIPDSRKLASIIEQESPEYSNRINTIKNRIQGFGFSFDVEALLSVLEFWTNPKTAIDETGAFFVEVSNRKSINSFRKHPSDLNVSKRAKEIIVKECFINDPSKIYDIKQKYTRFFKELHDAFSLANCDPAGNEPCPPIDVFTTNYDNVIEEYCFANGMTYCDGYREVVGSSRGTYVFDKDCYADSQKLLRLYKLHGTVTYVRLTNGELRLMPLFPGGDLQISGKPAFFDLIYPGTYRYATREPQLELLNLLKQNLLSCTGCIIIGYSFRDPNIRQIFKDVLLGRKKTKQRCKSILVSKEAERVIAKRGLGSLGIVPVKKKFEELNVKQDVRRHL